MYNILVVDDEEIVVEALFSIIGKNFEGQVKLYSACTGADAISICTKNQVDIIFMDIHMPGMTGLEAIKCILNLKPDTVIIILSAYDSFQYAQEALNLGAFKYITKPVNRNLVVSMIRTAMNQVDVKEAANLDGGYLQKKLALVSPVLESDFFYDCIFNRTHSENVYTYFDYFDIKEEFFAIGCFEFPGINSSNQKEMYGKARDIFHSYSKCLVSALLVNRIIVLFYFDKNQENSSEGFCKETMENMYTVLCLKIERGIRGGFSKCFSDISLISEKYGFSVEALNSASSKGEIIFSDEQKQSESKEKADADNLLSRLYTRLRLGDSAEIPYILRSYIDYLGKRTVDLDYMKSQIFEIFVNVRNILHEIDVKHRFQALEGSFSAISKMNDESELCAYAILRIEQAANSIRELKSRKINPIISKLIVYLDENISEDLSLEMAAKVAGVNPFYLSKLFREETGETFVNHISEKRMQMGKKLLLETEFSVKEIASKIGYNDQNYFSKLFKAKFGVSPTDFRKSR